MATQLFLRNTTANGITDTGDGTVYDMIPTVGPALDSGIVGTVASGTEIQWTKTNGGPTIAFISGRVPAGGFTLTSTEILGYFRESNMNANCTSRFRVFRYQPGPTITELGGGPFTDDFEFSTVISTHGTIGNVTDTAFSENDRILLRVYITNVGTMGGGFTCTIQFNGDQVAEAESWFQITENVTFKAEESTGQPTMKRWGGVPGMKPGSHGLRSWLKKFDFDKGRGLWLPRPCPAFSFGSNTNGRCRRRRSSVSAL